MILEASEFIKIINGLRSEVRNYSDIIQDDMNKINEKIIEEYDKTLKNSLNSQKELNNKIEKLETDKHKLIEENKRLEEQLSNLEYREKELKEAREQIELFKQQNQSYSDKIYDLEKEINSNQEVFIDTINKYNNTVKTLTDDRDKLKSEIAFFKINNSVNLEKRTTS